MYSILHLTVNFYIFSTIFNLTYYPNAEAYQDNVLFSLFTLNLILMVSETGRSMRQLSATCTVQQRTDQIHVPHLANASLSAASLHQYRNIQSTFF